jgi:hypothetical protein
MRTIKTKTADDGTELALKKRGDGEYVVTEKGSGQRTGQIETNRRQAEQNLEETASLYGNAASSTQGKQSSGMDAGFGGGMSGGAFGGSIGDGLYDSGESTDADSTTDSGGLFGGGGGSGGLFGGLGGNSGGGDSVRDPQSGKFAPKRREPTDFEMERDEQGRFTGRADENKGDDTDGFLGRFL